MQKTSAHWPDQEPLTVTLIDAPAASFLVVPALALPMLAPAQQAPPLFMPTLLTSATPAIGGSSRTVALPPAPGPTTTFSTPSFNVKASGLTWWGRSAPGTGVRAWSAQGFATEQGSTTGCLVETNDVVLSPSIRGNKEEMQRYLDWEVNLTH